MVQLPIINKIFIFSRKKQKFIDFRLFYCIDWKSSLYGTFCEDFFSRFSDHKYRHWRIKALFHSFFWWLDFCRVVWIWWSLIVFELQISSHRVCAVIFASNNIATNIKCCPIFSEIWKKFKTLEIALLNWKLLFFFRSKPFF